MPKWLARFLRIHSPSGHMLGTCWCQKDAVYEPLAAEEVARMIVTAYYRNRYLEEDGE